MGQKWRTHEEVKALVGEACLAAIEAGEYPGLRAIYGAIHVNMNRIVRARRELIERGVIVIPPEMYYEGGGYRRRRRLPRSIEESLAKGAGR